MVFRDMDMLTNRSRDRLSPETGRQVEGTYGFAGLHSCSGDLHWPSNDIYDMNQGQRQETLVRGLDRLRIQGVRPIQRGIPGPFRFGSYQGT